MLSEADYEQFALSFRKQFLAPEAEYVFLKGWKRQLQPFTLDVLKFALEQTAADVRILHKPPQMFLPIILDYASEEKLRRLGAAADEIRRREYREWQASLKQGGA
jgi:hypothetical protein